MKLTKSKERVKKFGEVFTPEWVVKDMVDNCEPDISQVKTTVLEPAVGTGNFLVEILNRKLKNCKDRADVVDAIKSMYAVDILPDNVAETRQRLFELTIKIVLEQNIIEGDFLKIADELEQYFIDWRN